MLCKDFDRFSLQTGLHGKGTAKEGQEFLNLRLWWPKVAWFGRIVFFKVIKMTK